MSLINITSLTFCYDRSYDTIFENTSFQIDTDWKLGFTGRNGRGKTTFFNLLLGKYEYSGSISANVDFDYFPYDVKDKLKETLEILREVGGEFEQWELEIELSKLSVDEDVLYRPFETLSNGEQTKVLIAALFLKSNSFLLIDEPTNHLDIQAREIVANYLNSKKGFILISHDRTLLDTCVDHILSINKNSIEVQSGNFSSWYYNKELQDNFELKKNEKLKKDIKRLDAAAKRNANWSEKVEKSKKGTEPPTGSIDRGYVGHMAAKMMKRAKSVETRKQREVEEKEKLLKNIESTESLKLFPQKYHSNVLASFEKVSLYYDDKEVCCDVSFTINPGDRIALQGKNGSGKSSVLKLLCGEKIKYTGTYSVGSRLIVSYVPQDSSFLKGNLSDFARQRGIDESLFKAILRKLDFSRIQFEKDMSQYSAGQKKKVLIAGSLCEKAHLYVWDEPLNYIDVLSRIQIEELLTVYEPTILFVEHDAAFVDNIANKIVKL